ADTFDGNGNPTTYNGTTLTFDPENRMTAYGTAMTAGYRADGLRAWLSTSSGTTYFVYVGIVPICEVNSSGTVTACNTFGPAGLTSRHTTDSVFYAFDPQGNPAERLDSSDNILGSYAFDAFGARTTTDIAPDVYCSYLSRWNYFDDTSTGLELLGHRFFNQVTGEFVNRDPLSYGGGQNLYSYAAGNPLEGCDPAGTDPVDGITALRLCLLFGLFCNNIGNMHPPKNNPGEADSWPIEITTPGDEQIGDPMFPRPGMGPGAAPGEPAGGDEPEPSPPQRKLPTMPKSGRGRGSRWPKFCIDDSGGGELQGSGGWSFPSLPTPIIVGGALVGAGVACALFPPCAAMLGGAALVGAAAL
ncbi:MAG TPA: RHS repeat-associated core domain-containing protein, partial [Chthonomonadales bacterium]|nr:RHS repeat-associated core domain-containing protein [Chthonomonadales bacterium]